jgi:hypothetical protein
MHDLQEGIGFEFNVACHEPFKFILENEMITMPVRQSVRGLDGGPQERSSRTEINFKYRYHNN